MRNLFAAAALPVFLFGSVHLASANESNIATSLSANEIQRIDAIFADIASREGPGCAIAVERDGKVLYSHGYGQAQLEYKIPITPDTIFHVASVSKQFTAFAIALLEADGKLDLDDDVRKYVSEVPDFGQRITLRHLIHHTSGLRDQWDLVVLAGARMDDVISESDIMELVARQRELNFAPGEEHLYCNTGYTLLAVVVKRISGKSLEEFCEERMFQPLGMTRTHFHDDHRQIVPSRAYSYSPTGKDGFQNSVLSYANAGATSLFTTVGDLARWQHNFQSHDVGDERVFATILSLGQLNDGQNINYGGGLGSGTYRGLETIGHGGADAGFRSYLVRFPMQNCSISVLGNFTSFNPNGVAMKIADVVLDREFHDGAGQNETNGDSDQRSPVTDADENNSDVTTSIPDLTLCEGWYFDRASMAIYVVKKDDDGLHMQTGFRKPILLKQVSPMRFESTEARYPFAMEFHPTSDPFGRAIITFPGASPAQLQAVKEKNADIDYPAILPGRYYSEELDTFYNIIANGKELFVARRRYPNAPMRLRFHDCFGVGGNLIQLTRASDDQLDGFLLSSGRVRNLRFRRVTDWP